MVNSPLSDAYTRGMMASHPELFYGTQEYVNQQKPYTPFVNAGENQLIDRGASYLGGSGAAGEGVSAYSSASGLPSSLNLGAADSLNAPFASNPAGIPPISPVNFSTAIAPLAVGAIGAYTASRGLAAYQSAHNKGAWGGFKEGLDKAGPLKFVPMLGQLPALAGLVGGLSSGKSKAQQNRDNVRHHLRDNGVIDENNSVTLADGSKYDIGKDGHDPRYNVDMTRSGAGQAIGDVNPLAAILTGGDKKSLNDFAGYFANAALSNANDPQSELSNARALYQKSGVNRDSGFQAINDLETQGKIRNDEAAAYRNGLNVVFGQAPQPNQIPVAKAPTAQAVLDGTSGRTMSPTASGIDPTSMPKRTQTLSPGIGLDGKRINYSIPKRR